MPSQYRLIAPIHAIQRDRIITIPIGGRVRIVREPRESGLIEVQYEGDMVTLFAEDLRMRGEAVRAGAA